MATDWLLTPSLIMAFVIVVCLVLYYMMPRMTRPDVLLCGDGSLRIPRFGRGLVHPQTLPHGSDDRQRFGAPRCPVTGEDG